MHNVWVEGRRMLRSHINQLRSRTSADSKSPSGTSPPKANKQQLPLDILLHAWDLHQPSQHQPSRPSPLPSTSSAPSTLAAPSDQSTPLQVPAATPSLVWISPAPTESPEPSSSVSASTSPSRVPMSSATSSVPSTSAEFMSATETETAGPLPRRSSRQRRPPIRFDPYQLY